MTGPRRSSGGTAPAVHTPSPARVGGEQGEQLACFPVIGQHPCKKDRECAEVVEAELARSGFEAWYRNPGSATPASLRIAYQNDEEVWASLQPDFVVVSRRSDGSLGASIVDPHGDYLADARAKLQALAAFAEQFGDRFVRIESVAKVDDGSLRVLDLADPAVRAEVRAFEGGKVTVLYQSEVSRPYP